MKGFICSLVAFCGIVYVTTLWLPQHFSPAESLHWLCLTIMSALVVIAYEIKKAINLIDEVINDIEEDLK